MRCWLPSASDGEADELAVNLSHGAQRNLEIAIALATEPKLSVPGEPTAGYERGRDPRDVELIRRIAANLTISSWSTTWRW